MSYLTNENIIIICLILIIIYIILDKIYKKSYKEHFTEDEILNKLSNIINGEDIITFKDVYISNKLIAPELITRHIYADKDTSHGVDGNDYIDIMNKSAFYDTLYYKKLEKK